MPLYDFKCKSCNFKFSEFLEVGSFIQQCPYCQKFEVERDFSEMQSPQKVENRVNGGDSKTRVLKYIEEMRQDLRTYKEDKREKR